MSEFVRVAKTTEIPSSGCKRVHVHGQPIALFNLDGTFYAIHDICTHAHASLCEGSIAGDEVLCPLHFASFNIRTGPPADEDVKSYQVKIEGKDILVQC
jgi:nitrite reductase/ring-hydroxylating ferredoxin subunit